MLNNNKICCFRAVPTPGPSFPFLLLSSFPPSCTTVFHATVLQMRPCIGKVGVGKVIRKLVIQTVTFLVSPPSPSLQSLLCSVSILMSWMEAPRLEQFTVWTVPKHTPLSSCTNTVLLAQPSQRGLRTAAAALCHSNSGRLSFQRRQCHLLLSSQLYPLVCILFAICLYGRKTRVSQSLADL